MAATTPWEMTPGVYVIGSSGSFRHTILLPIDILDFVLVAGLFAALPLLPVSCIQYHLISFARQEWYLRGCRGGKTARGSSPSPLISPPFCCTDYAVHTVVAIRSPRAGAAKEFVGRFWAGGLVMYRFHGYVRILWYLLSSLNYIVLSSSCKFVTTKIVSL